MNKLSLSFIGYSERKQITSTLQLWHTLKAF